MDKIVDFELEKTRKETIAAAHEYESMGHDMALTALQALDELASVLRMDYETGKQYAQGSWEKYLLFSAFFAEYCVDWFELEESDLQKTLQGIVEELHARTQPPTNTTE